MTIVHAVAVNEKRRLSATWVSETVEFTELKFWPNDCIQ